MSVQENAKRQAEQDEPGEDGRPKKRGRGRPLGSKTKPRPEDELGPADTVEVSARAIWHAIACQVHVTVCSVLGTCKAVRSAQVELGGGSG